MVKRFIVLQIQTDLINSYHAFRIINTFHLILVPLKHKFEQINTLMLL
jgi:hypothetical protein